MEFIEKLNIGGEIVLEKLLNLVIVGIYVNQVMARAYTGCVGINDEDGTIEGVKED